MKKKMKNNTCANCKYNQGKICKNKKSFYWYRVISEDKCCKCYEKISIVNVMKRKWRKK